MDRELSIMSSNCRTVQASAQLQGAGRPEVLDHPERVQAWASLSGIKLFMRSDPIPSQRGFPDGQYPENN